MSVTLIQIDDDEFKKIIAEAFQHGAQIAIETTRQKKYHYTEKEVMHLFNISSGTLANWRSDGRIAYEGTRGNLRYPKRSVDELIGSLRRDAV